MAKVNFHTQCKQRKRNLGALRCIPSLTICCSNNKQEDGCAWSDFFSFNRRQYPEIEAKVKYVLLSSFIWII